MFFSCRGKGRLHGRAHRDVETAGRTDCHQLGKGPVDRGTAAAERRIGGGEPGERRLLGYVAGRGTTADRAIAAGRRSGIGRWCDWGGSSMPVWICGRCFARLPRRSTSWWHATESACCCCGTETSCGPVSRWSSTTANAGWKSPRRECREPRLSGSSSGDSLGSSPAWSGNVSIRKTSGCTIRGTGRTFICRWFAAKRASACSESPRAPRSRSDAWNLEVLGEWCDHLATALDNASAYGEIARLKGQLEEQNVYLRDEIKTTHDFGNIVGDSPAMRHVRAAIEQVAATDSTVLILGETGTGKELVARAIHDLSPRHEHLLVKVNCAALAPTLMTSELFGHEAGAFTGATKQHQGRFELAQRGSIFLDEIAEVPPETQVMMLRVLQERRHRTRRRQSVDSGRRPGDHRNQPRLEEVRRRRALSRGPVLSAECLSDPSSGPSRAPGGHPLADQSLHHPLRPPHEQGDHAASIGERWNC